MGNVCSFDSPDLVRYAVVGTGAAASTFIPTFAVRATNAAYLSARGSFKGGEYSIVHEYTIMLMEYQTRTSSQRTIHVNSRPRQQPRTLTTLSLAHTPRSMALQLSHLTSFLLMDRVEGLIVIQ